MSGRARTLTWLSTWGLLIIIAFMIVCLPLIWALHLSRQLTLLLQFALTYIGPLGVAVCATWYVGLGQTSTREGRRFWVLLASAHTALLLADVYWLYYTVSADFRGPRFGSFVSVLQAVGVVVMITAMAQLTSTGWRSGVVRLRFYLDLAAAIIVAWLGVYLYWTLPYLAPLAGREVSGYGAGYIVIGGTFVLFALPPFIRWSGYRWRRWERLIGAAVVVFGAGVMLEPVWLRSVVVGEAHRAGWYTLMLGCGFWAVIAAALSRIAEGSSGQLLEPWPPLVDAPVTLRRWYALIVAAALLVTAAPVLAHDDSTLDQVVLTVGMLLTVVLVARSWLLAYERVVAERRITTDRVTGAWSSR
ncbi:MAG: hypothetical protein FDZ75_05740, partial [Actinobacteria bacterium]